MGRRGGGIFSRGRYSGGSGNWWSRCFNKSKMMLGNTTIIKCILKELYWIILMIIIFYLYLKYLN